MISTLLIASQLQISFVGPCDKKPIVKETMTHQYANVGELTVKFLESKHIPFVGTEFGISSVFNTPMGDEALEIISKSEMRAYGWCYFVDDMGPDELPNQYPLEGIKKVEWVFGYAHYKDGQWVSNCVPAFKTRPKFLCQK